MLKPLAILIFPLLMHPVHVSMSSLSLDSDARRYIMTVRIYNDDLAIDLARLYGVEQITVEDHYIRYNGPDSFLESYVNDNLKIKFNNREVSAEFKEKEVRELETIIILNLNFNRRVKSIEVENKILTSLYPDQVNLFIYKDNEIEKGIRFTSMYKNETLKKE